MQLGANSASQWAARPAGRSRRAGSRGVAPGPAHAGQPRRYSSVKTIVQFPPRAHRTRGRRGRRWIPLSSTTTTTLADQPEQRHVEGAADAGVGFEDDAVQGEAPAALGAAEALGGVVGQPGGGSTVEDAVGCMAMIVRRRPLIIAALRRSHAFPMALRATIFKARLSLADMDRGLYADHALTLARRLRNRRAPADARAGLRAERAGRRPRRACSVRQGLSDTDGRSLAPRPHRPHPPLGRGRPADDKAPAARRRPGRPGQRLRLRRQHADLVERHRQQDRPRGKHPRLAGGCCAEPGAGGAGSTYHGPAGEHQDGTCWVGDGERSVEITPRRLET